MSNQQLAQRSPAVTRRGTIADGQSTSSVIDKRGYPILGMRFVLSDAATLTFSVCDTADGTFDTVKDRNGSSVSRGSFTAARHALSAEDLAFLAPFNFFKVITSAAQSAGTAGATFDVDLMA